MAGKDMISRKSASSRKIHACLFLAVCLVTAASCAGLRGVPEAIASEYPYPSLPLPIQSAPEKGPLGPLPNEGNPPDSPLFVSSTPAVYLPAIFNRSGGFPPISPEEMIRSMLGQVNLERAVDDLKRLSGEELICTVSGCNWILNRSTGSEGLVWAKEYVLAEFSELGYQVEYQNWSRSGYSDQNIIARKTGYLLPGEEIYLVAHLDGVDKSGSDRFPAADDNGSGVVSLLELARVFSRYMFTRTLVILISTGEENGTLGVLEYLEDLSPAEFAAVSKVINIDMIGYDANHDRVMQLWHGDHSPSKAFAQSMRETILYYQLDLIPELAVGCG